MGQGFQISNNLNSKKPRITQYQAVGTSAIVIIYPTISSITIPG
jgi:hypothetical protein